MLGLKWFSSGPTWNRVHHGSLDLEKTLPLEGSAQAGQQPAALHEDLAYRLLPHADLQLAGGIPQVGKGQSPMAALGTQPPRRAHRLAVGIAAGHVVQGAGARKRPAVRRGLLGGPGPPPL